MECPSCNHVNISDFPFCEECLTLLPKRPDSDLAFDLDVEHEQTPTKSGQWPPFPWNPETRAQGFWRDKPIQTLLDSWRDVVSTDRHFTSSRERI